MYLVKPANNREVAIGGQKIPLKGIEIKDNQRVHYIRHAQRGDITIEKIEEIKQTKAPKGDA
ncbi:MAG TPA: hypothetical protein VIH30_03565 [Aquirhabdus sp.]